MDGIVSRALLSLAIAAGAVGLWRILSLVVLGKAKGAAAESALAGFAPGKPGILVFGSPGCPTCVHAQDSAARKAALTLGSRAQLLEVNVDERPELARRYGVVSLPTVFVLDGSGEPRRVYHGFVSAAELASQVEPLAAH
jgi:Thiol-disulfide isomerase and thioredoxins